MSKQDKRPAPAPKAQPKVRRVRRPRPDAGWFKLAERARLKGS